MDLTKLAPARWSTALVSNLNQGDAWTVVAGAAQGYTVASSAFFEDAYLVLQSNKYDLGPSTNLQFALAGAATNHLTPASFAHASDAVGTLALTYSVNPMTTFLSMAQYGTQMTGNGQTVNLIEDYNVSHAALNKQVAMNPWDVIFGSPAAAGDENIAGAFIARGSNFAPPDGPSDVLAGLSGFAGDVTFYPPSAISVPGYRAWGPDPCVDKCQAPLTPQAPPMRIDLAGWSFGDVVPRYQNLAASVTEIIAEGFGITAKASRGYIATSAASANFSGVPLTDGQGGQTPIPQSTTALSLVFGGSTFKYPNLTDGKVSWNYPTSQWSASLGYAVATQAACNPGIPPCYSSRYGQLTAAGTLDGPDGFLNFAIGPANIATHPGAVSQSTDTSTASQFGGFLNKNSWTGTAGVHIKSPSVCNSIVVAASNSAAAPDIVANAPGTTLSVAAYAEVVPLTWNVPMVGFIGFVHQIQNVNQQSSLAGAASLPGQFVSTVTYAISIAVGTEGYRNALRSNCALSKPAPQKT
jgi:hypothetical protein